jgi:hypothetical protein
MPCRLSSPPVIPNTPKDFEGKNLDGFSDLLERGGSGLRRLSECECADAWIYSVLMIPLHSR